MSETRERLKFPLMALQRLGNAPAEAHEKGAARALYRAAMRATQRLVMGVGRQSIFNDQLLSPRKQTSTA